MSHSLQKDFGNNRKHRAVDRELQHRSKYNFVGVVRGGASQDALLLQNSTEACKNLSLLDF